MAQEVTFTITGNPVGKPRQTRRDKWLERPCVLRYRAWADTARLSAPSLPESPSRVRAVAFLPIPLSLSKHKRDGLKGQPHRVKPDADNIAKSILDSLFANDAVIYDLHVLKFYDDGQGARIEVSVW